MNNQIPDRQNLIGMIQSGDFDQFIQSVYPSLQQNSAVPNNSFVNNQNSMMSNNTNQTNPIYDKLQSLISNKINNLYPDQNSMNPLTSLYKNNGLVFNPYENNEGRFNGNQTGFTQFNSPNNMSFGSYNNNF